MVLKWFRLRGVISVEGKEGNGIVDIYWMASLIKYHKVS